MLRCSPILADRRNWMHGFHRPSKMRFLTFCLNVALHIGETPRFYNIHNTIFLNDQDSNLKLPCAWMTDVERLDAVDADPVAVVALRRALQVGVADRR